MINKPDELWQKRLDNLFQKKSKTQTEKFLDIVSIILYMNDKCKDITDLYSTVDLETFIKIVHLFSNRTIYFPDKKEIKDSIELALIYYYKNIQGIDNYKDLKKLNIIDEKDFSSISLGKRLNKLDEQLQEKLLEIFMEIENEK
jgi:hypothetical protein